MKTMKRILSMVLVLCMVLGYIPAHAHAMETGNEDATPVEATAAVETNADVQEQTALPTVELPSNEELFAGYAEAMLYGMNMSAFATGDRSAGAKLTGDNKLVYDALIPFIQKIAKGERVSTVIKLGWSDQYGTDKYIAFTGTAEEFSLESVMNALLTDHPYEMYWYNKLSFARSSSMATYPENKLLWMEISMPVAAPFASGEYTADTAQTSAVTSAVDKAASIVSKYASANDHDKLVGYRNEICNLVSYDTSAASGGNTAYNTNSNPWQLIHVFDGNTTTNVVCEGYAKAFQYLCDLGGVPCISVSGNMSGGVGSGAHMWNIVTLNGKNYLVDVTNSDTGTVGQDGELFLAEGSGSVDEGYSFSAGGKTISYEYDYDTLHTWSAADLTLAGSNSDSVEAILQPAAPNGANGWYTNVNLIAPEGYQIAVSQSGEWSSTLDIPEGQYGSFTYVLKDENGAVIEKTLGAIKVDGAAPAVSEPAVQLDSAAGEATIIVEATDALSGIASYELTGATNSLQGNTFTVTGLTWNKEYTLTLKVTDNAGNTATESISLIRSCDHSTTRGEDNGDGTHKLVCTNTACNYVVEESATHTFASSTGKCGQCQADMEEVATVTISGVTTYHQTLSDAVTEAKNGTTAAPATVKLLCDISLDSELEIESGVFTLDLNDRELNDLERNSYAESVLVIIGGEVTVADSGTDPDKGVILGYGAYPINQPGGILNITGGTISCATVDHFGAAILSNNTLNISGGTVITDYGYGVHAVGSSSSSSSTLNISGGTISGTIGVYTSNDTTVTITGGTISGTECDLYNSDSTITLGLGASGIGATFPDGLKVGGTTLNAILAEGAAYWQDGKMIVLADGLNEISGGDVTIKAECTHENTEKTYQDIGNGFHIPGCAYCGVKLEADKSQHTTVADENKATCQKQAVCDLCGVSYGEVDDTNHDETVAFINGFCPNCDEYEPAVLNNGVYEISNAGQLYWFAQKVNSGETSINGKLTTDIVIEDNIDSKSGGLKRHGSEGLRDWNPIGNNNCQYSGTFDGGDHTVSGLYLNNTGKDYVGLFGYVAAGGTIQNVSIEITHFHGKNHVGGVVGYNEGNVKNCHNEGEVCSTDSNGDAGGVVGYNDGAVQRCSNSGNVFTTGQNGIAGGVVGNNRRTVEDCSNTGDATGDSNKNNVGGVVGYNEGTVQRCFNTSMLCNYGKAPISLGGVVGYNYGKVLHCYNTGKIENHGTALDLTQNDPIAAGGVVGFNNGIVQHCYNIGAVTSTKEGRNILIGDVVGSDRYIVQNCFYQAERENDSVDGITFKTDAQFASGEVAYLLGVPFGQNIDNGKPVQTYPNFTGAAVYYGYTSCGDTAMHLTNDSGATQTKPEHTDSITYAVNATDSGKHDKTYDCCGTVVTEVHSFDETTGKCVCGTDCAHSFDPATGKCDVCQANIAVATVTIGETTTYCRTLDDAIQAVANCTAADRAVVKLITDIDLGSNDQEINSGVFTIDLNGKTLSNSNIAEAVLYIHGSNTIKPDVTITGGNISSSQGFGVSACLYSTVTITDCTITGNKYGVYTYSQSTVTITDCTITSNEYGVHTGLLSTVTITDCTITSNKHGVYTDLGSTVTITGSTVTSIDTDSSGVYTASQSTVTIEDSKISGGRYGVYAKGLNVTIKSGEIDGEGLYGVYATGGNVTITGGAITGNNVDLNYSSGTLKLTLAEGATEGATFPNGLRVSGTTLNAILAEGAAYWQGAKMILPADDATVINGSDVTIKAVCKHENVAYPAEDIDADTHKKVCSCGYEMTEAHTFDSATGKCAVCQTDLAVATVTIGETTITYCRTLDDAIQAVANCTAADKAVVKLITDIDIGSNYQEINSGVFTIDLNGKNLSNTDVGILRVIGGHVTIADNGNNGTINSPYGVTIDGGNLTVTGGTIIGNSCIWAAKGSFIIEGGTFKSISEKTSGFTVFVGGRYSAGTINGGTFIRENAKDGATISVSDNASLTITGGRFINEVGYDVYGTTDCVIDLKLADGATSGAVFTNGIKVRNTTLSVVLGTDMAYWQGDKMIILTAGQTEITGGDVTIKAVCKHDESKLSYEDNQNGLTHKVSCSCGYLLDEGKEHTFNADTGKCAVCQADIAVATVTIGETTTYSRTLDDAIHAVEDCTAADKAVVKLLTDINLGSNYQEITSGVFTIDLNGFELSGSATSYGVLYIVGNDTAKSDVTITDSGEGGIISSSQKNGVYATGSTVTITGGTITGSEYGVYANSDSTVNIDGGTIIGEDGGINITSSNVSITGGTITDSSMSSYGVFVTLGKATITGGEISGGMYGITAGSRCTVSIQGGEISGTYAVLSVNQCSVTITGGALTGELKIVGSLKLGLGQNRSGATFLGGLTVNGTTLNAILAEGAAYWQGAKMILPADNATAINGSDVTIKAVCKHDESKLSYEDNQDDLTHKVICACGYIGEENHTFNAETGKCAFCDAACDHATKNADGNCGICGYNPIASFTVSGESSWSYDPNHDVALTLAHTLKEGYQAGEVYYTHDKENAPKYTESAISLGKGWNAGTHLYTMKVYVDGFFKSVNYTAIVSKVNPNAAHFVFSAPAELTYNGYGKVASVVLAEGLDGCGQLTVCYRAVGTAQWTNDAPVEPGTYEVGVRVGSGTNFNAPYENRPVTSENWTFTIEKRTIKAEDFVFNPPSTLIYDGQAKEAYLLPIDNVSAAGMGLFTYKYRDSEGNLLEGEPVNVGTYTLVVDVTEGTYYKAATNLTSENWTFTIEKGQAVIHVDDTTIEVTYGETVELPEATSNFGTVTCDLTAADMVNVGTYNVIYSVAGSDNYHGAEKTVTVIVNPNPLTEGDVELLGELTYNGSEQAQMITVPDGVTYEISGNKATNAGTYEMSVTVSGNYTGTVTKQWSIGKLDIFDANVVIDDCLEYNGAPQTAVILQVNAGVVVLNEETDYTVSGNVRTNAGSYELTVTGTGNFTGTAKAYWFIQKRPVNLVAEGQTISYGSTISQNAYTIDGLVEGHTAVITLVSSTDQVTADGEIQIDEVKIMADGVDVTENYITGLAAPAKLVITPDASQIKDLTTENVTSADQEKLENVLEQLEHADSLTEDWEELLENVQQMLERIEEVQAAPATENVEKTLEVTAENVQKTDREALEAAKADLKDILNEFGGNYTEEEKKAIEAEIDRIADALKAIGNAEKVEETIGKLPETVEPDDGEAALKILDAQADFDALSDHEKTLVDAMAKEKLDALMEALTAYRLTLGGGGIYTQESGGTLSFTANGPFSKFVGIRVDGKDVDKANYDAKSGSTIITLKAAYLETLTVGEHTLIVRYTDGQVNGTFTVKAAETVPPTTEEEETEPPTTEEEETVPPTTEEEETEPPTTEEEETVPPTTEEEETVPPTTEEEEIVPPTTEDEPSVTPPTGDDFQPMLWIAVMCMSFGLLVLMKERRKSYK